MGKLFDRLLKKYDDVNIEVKASFWYMVCSVLTRGLSFITMPIFTRILTTSDYGIVNLFSSWSVMVNVFATLYLPYGSFGVAMQKFKEDRDGYVSSVQWLLVCSVLCSFGICMIVEFFSPGYVVTLSGLDIRYIYLMFISVFFSSIQEFWMGRNRYEYRYKKVVFLTIFLAIVSPLLSYLAVCYGAEKAFMKVAAGVVVSGCVGVVIFFINAYKAQFVCCWKYCKYALKFNIPLIPYYLTQMAFNQSDRIMIAQMIGLDKAGIYGVAHAGSLAIAFVIEAISNSFTPWLYANIESKDFASISKISNKLLVTVSGVLIAFMMIAPEIVKFLAPSQYHDGIWVMPPLIAGLYFLFVARFYNGVIFFYQKSFFLVYITAITCVTNIGLNYIFIPKYGFVSAGCTTLVAFIMVACLNYAFMRFIANYENFGCYVYDNAFIAKYSVSFLILTGAITYSYSLWFVRVILLVVFVILAYMEREWIKELLESIKSNKKRKC